MRTCVFCGRSIDGRRPQAKSCSASCRAAASRARAAQRAAEARAAAFMPLPDETAQKRTEGRIREGEYRPATPAEEKRVLRLVRDHADLWRGSTTMPLATPPIMATTTVTPATATPVGTKRAVA